MITAIDISELQKIQRSRSQVMKSRIMAWNRLVAIVAGAAGYRSGLSEKERKKKFCEAEALIHKVDDGQPSPEPIIPVSLIGINAFLEMEATLLEQQLALVQELPIIAWVDEPEQKGFGRASLAVLLGEAGDLNNYATVSKLWRRFGLAPWTYDGKNWMGATWKSGKQGKLPADQWEKFGYSPKRRSLAFVWGDNLVKQNGDGPYRQRYDEGKTQIKAKNPGYTPMRCHRHGMILATKLLLKNIWCAWKD